MASRLNYSGLLIAGIGFFLTRFTVTLSLYEAPVRFYFAGVVPLTLGLGLAAFGVALAVADVDDVVVRTTAVWCVAGAAAMLLLVVLTLLGSGTGELPRFDTVRSRAYLSNFLIGGSVGGALTGLYASRTRTQRNALSHRANRLKVLNRLLRHEVLNSVNVIRGYAGRTTDGGTDPEAVIRDHSENIEDTINEVRFLARDPDSQALTETTLDLNDCVEASVAAVEAEHPQTTISFHPHPDDPAICADENLGSVFTALLGYGVDGDTDTPDAIDVEVAASPGRVRVDVTSDGFALSERQRALLRTGKISEYDDPNSGFALNKARLLVESYSGRVETQTRDGTTTVSVVLPRGDDPGGDRPLLPTVGPQTRPTRSQLLVTLAASLVAGVSYGVVSELLGGSIAGIGVFYGTVSPVVGWLTHEFHSVVFGFAFVGFLSTLPARFRTSGAAYAVLGVAWALLIWVVAAGLVAPVWLRLLGIPAALPNLTVQLLAAHVVWGATLGFLTALGYRFLSRRQTDSPQ